MPKVTIIGAGPAGLTAAYTLQKAGISTLVLEADPTYVGGIARTVQYKGFRFDIGGHRFFSKSKEIEDLWDEILPDDFLDRPRSSRIFYRGKFFSYPLKAFDALFKLGVIEATLCVLSYARARLWPQKNTKSFEDWVTQQFGQRLYRIFFKTYTEKVWGMPCSEISADWAAQRIKGLSLASAIKNALTSSFRVPFRARNSAPQADKSGVIKTLIDSFRYPRKGPGMMWEKCVQKVVSMGGEVRMGCEALGASFNSSTHTWTVRYKDANGNENSVNSEFVMSSAPLRDMLLALTPKVSEKTISAASGLKYRDFLIVALILKDQKLFDDNWIYIHDPDVKVGRVQNFKSWSPDMVPDPSLACYGLEYFCFEGDGLWNSADADLLNLAKSELEKIGLGKQGDVLDGCVVRQKKAYPVYDDHYSQNVAVVRQALETSFPGFISIGRNGMHKYNNQDHAMMTGMLAAKNIIAGKTVFDIWNVNQDAEYLEEGRAGTQTTSSLGERSVPGPKSSSASSSRPELSQ